MRNHMQENRKHIRWPLSGRVRFKLLNNEQAGAYLEEKPATLKDISFAGAKIALVDSLHLNSRLDLAIETAQGEPNPMQCEGRVVWQSSAGEGEEMPFVCGVSFTNLKDSDKERIFQSVHLFASENLKHKWWNGVK